MTEHITGRQARKLLELPDIAAPWVIEQRNLAETVAWLYAPDGPPDGHDVTARGGTVWLDGIDHTPDEAVDLARALLAAAEGARDGVDR